MPVFNFSSIKQTKERKRISSDIEIIEHNIEGIVCIRLDGKFYINYNKELYKIYPECYNCKDKGTIYSLQINNNRRLQYIRSENKQELSHKVFLPFAPGCVIKGNLIKDKNNIYVKIKKVFIDNDIDLAKHEWQFYKINYEQIMQERLKDDFIE